MDKTNKEIDLEKRRLEDANGGNHARRVREVEDAKLRAAEAKAEFDGHREAQPLLEEQLRATQDDARRLSPVIEAKKSEIEQCKNHIRTLHRNQGQHIESFHDRMPLLLRAIREEPRFREKPVGPIGNHVRLLKPEWSSILERSFGGTLSTFIVTSVQDQGVLSELMRRVTWYVSILNFGTSY